MKEIWKSRNRPLGQTGACDISNARTFVCTCPCIKRCPGEFAFFREALENVKLFPLLKFYCAHSFQLAWTCKPASEIDIPHSSARSHCSHLLCLSRLIVAFLPASFSASIVLMYINKNAIQVSTL